MNRDDAANRKHRILAPLALATLASFSNGCHRSGEEWAHGAHDVPALESEPRATVGVTLALAPQVDCDEAFALSLYQEPGVELIVWRPAGKPLPPSSCRERRATIRYLTRRISRKDLLRHIETLSLAMKVDK